MARMYVSDQRRQNHQNYIEFLNKCNELFVRGAQTPDPRQNCAVFNPPVSVAFGNIVNSSKFATDHCPIGPRNIEEMNESCFTVKYVKDATASHRIATDSCTIVPKSLINENEPIISMLNQKYDTKSAANLRDIAQRKKCELHFASDVNDAQTVFFEGTANQVIFSFVFNMIKCNCFPLFNRQILIKYLDCHVKQIEHYPCWPLTVLHITYLLNDLAVMS